MKGPHKKIVLVMFENRSFHNIYGQFNNPHLSNVLNDEKKTKKKFFNTNSQNQKVFCTQGLETDLKKDPAEGPENMEFQIGNSMNGFVKSYEKVLRTSDVQELKPIMATIDSNRIPVLTQLAETFIVCDHYHSSLPTMTIPNRCCQHSGDYGNQLTNQPYTHWISQTLPTLFDQMSDNNLSFKIYYDERDILPFTFLIHYQSLKNKQEHVVNHSTLWKDFENNTLPLYSFIEPRFLIDPADYHPPDSDNFLHLHNSVQNGEYFLSQIYNAWKNSPGRDEILLIINFDESGGLFDEILPPKGWGPRVPALFISTHLNSQTHVCSTELQHMSILKTLHQWLNLPFLSEIEKTCNVIPESLFTSEITLQASQIPEIKSNDSVSVLDEKLLSLNTLAKDIIMCGLTLCNAEKKVNFETDSVNDILNYLSTLKQKQNRSVKMQKKIFGCFQVVFFLMVIVYVSNLFLR